MSEKSLSLKNYEASCWRDPVMGLCSCLSSGGKFHNADVTQWLDFVHAGLVADESPEERNVKQIVFVIKLWRYLAHVTQLLDSVHAGLVAETFRDADVTQLRDSVHAGLVAENS